ncbi:MAG: hypothetical protein MHPSP_004566, partial [Paramarteilia canceri]
TEFKNAYDEKFTPETLTDDSLNSFCKVLTNRDLSYSEQYKVCQVDDIDKLNEVFDKIKSNCSYVYSIVIGLPIGLVLLALLLIGIVIFIIFKKKKRDN